MQAVTLAACCLPTTPVPPAPSIPRVWQVAAGSQPFNCGPAMTAQECSQALEAGAEAVAVACQHMAAAAADPAGWTDSQGVVCVGEIGIGNTTAAAALIAALCPGLSPADVCGRGTGGLNTLDGLTQASCLRKKPLMESKPVCILCSLTGHQPWQQPWPDGPMQSRLHSCCGSASVPLP